MTAAFAPDNAAETARRSTTIAGEALPPVDFYGLDELLTREERDVRDRVRAFVDTDVVPIIGPYWERGEFPGRVIPKLKALGLAGGDLQGYGCPGVSAVANGLVSSELSRGDGSVATFFGVHSGLVMSSVALCGDDEQKARWLPPMARMDLIGAFALTEPFVGSDAAHIATRARRDGDGYVLDGEKRWIGNADVADVLVVWARDDDGSVGAFLVEGGAPGLEVQKMAGKSALRALVNCDVTLRGVRVAAENRLANAVSFRDTGRVLARVRSGVACGALGHAMACYEAALGYTARREQFGKPLAAFQLVQEKLVWMLTEITAMQLLCWRLGKLLESGHMTSEQASMAKLNNAAKARQVAAAARDLLGGNGILLENVVARHQADLEAVFTYEGTDHIQTLLVGRQITGLSAFA